jgi:hypothetical protein
MVANDHCGEPIQTAPLGFRRSLEQPHPLEGDPATIGIAVSQRRLGLASTSRTNVLPYS